MNIGDIDSPSLQNRFDGLQTDSVFMWTHTHSLTAGPNLISQNTSPPATGAVIHAAYLYTVYPCSLHALQPTSKTPPSVWFVQRRRTPAVTYSQYLLTDLYNEDYVSRD